MPRRIDIELTSARSDGTWTWRAAGAREPRGVLDGGLLHEGAKTGDVLRAEAEFELEGIVIVSVAAPKTDRRSEPQRIEIVGPGRPEGPGVTTQLVGRGDRRPGGERRRERPPRERTGGRPQAGREGGRPEREGAGVRGGRGERRPDAGREGGGRRTGEGGRPPARAGSPERERPDRRPAPARTSSTSDRTRGRRLSPGSKHRREVLDSLPPEQQAIAEHLLRGGIPAVRTALHLEREKAAAEGRPAPNSDELLALAESLLPRLRAAEWRDRAEAAVAEMDSISLRDLRSVVAGADLARDDETRALGAQLREGLDRRVGKLHSDWAADIVAQLDAGRTVRAVRLSGKAPDPSARLEPELATRLTEAAGAVLSPETAPDLWAAMLEAVAESPIRRSVTPTGLPAEAPPELKRAAHQLSGTIPALAKLLGVTIPPPPAPLPARRRGEGGGRQGGRGAGREPRPSAEPTLAPPTATGGETPGPEAAAEAVGVETPTTEASTIEAAGVETPTAETPTTEAPTTETPTTEAPTAEAPTSEADAPEAPEPGATAVEAAGSEEATTEAPAADPLATAVAGIEGPSEETAATESEPGTAQPDPAEPGEG